MGDASRVALLLAGICVACGGKPSPNAQSCPFQGSITASDSRVGVPCKAELSLRVGDEWVAVNSLPGSTGGTFRGSIGAVTSGAVSPPARIAVRCDGYAEQSREYHWTLVPGECKDLAVGDFVVSPSARPTS